MTEKEVRDAVRAWIASLMGITVIQSYQGQKEPAEPYGVLNLMLADSVRELPAAMEITSVGAGENEVFTQTTAHEWFWRFSVNVYGGEGKTLLRQIKTAQFFASTAETLRPLTLFETSAIRDAAEILNEEWRARAQMDIEIRGIVRDGVTVDVVDVAPVQITKA
ncbi:MULTISPECIES: LIC_12616 family protein [unclassified Aureimonas]|uniref:phage neck terminator protein n=1 Tax=unclassified Aureimonas TaxID=2615206 RepID=UPI000700022C|nr:MULTISPECIES: hypothetical protein [unclassified Aureimonas]KQT52220.1 hypothetical protein ASG62_16310 [Aureimonas sp. Leaf427]KQT70546.1 hypothetical protein ASG54_21640 [Aureimonas sp. Leaf460]